MSTIFVDFAVCPCGEQTAVRPTTPAIANANPQSSETDEYSILLACPKCKRVYTFDTDCLVSLPTPWGIGPYNPEAPTRVFHVPVSCAQLDCGARPRITVQMKSNTSAEELRQERLSWRWSEDDLRCSVGHAIPWPQWEI